MHRRLPSPRTPRTPSASSLSLFASNRASTDSGASSNADQRCFEWKPDQIRLLARTLDALPPQLVTPFNGPIPPSNLLDKIARGVAQAKGPVDWPHSLRATRVKLIELSRARASEDVSGDAQRKRRPLCKQSSMDFMSNADLGAGEAIELVTDRLQQSTKSNFHPYACFACTATSTPSSSTLNTLSSFSASRILRRASSNLSSTSASSVSIPRPDSKKENLEAPPLAGAKRGPSFGAFAQEARRGRHVLAGLSSSADNACPSSDDEEKLRAKAAKKMRVKDTAASTPPHTPVPKKTRPKAPATAPSKSSAAAATTKEPHRKPRAPPMSAERNPSMFGAELPPVGPAPAPAGVLLSPPVSPRPRTLRRVPRVVLGRRISFGSLCVPGGDADAEGPGGVRRALGQLGSAFQLR